MIGKYVYCNKGGFSVNCEASKFAIFTPPYKLSNNQIVSKKIANNIWHYCFS